VNSAFVRVNGPAIPLVLYSITVYCVITHCWLLPLPRTRYLLLQLATALCSVFYYLAYNFDVACNNGDVQQLEVGESRVDVEVEDADAATAVVSAVAQAMVQHPAAADLQVSL
jgi:hypothetical protein